MKKSGVENVAIAAGKAANIIAEHLNDPYGVIKIVFGLTSIIYEQAMLVKANKKQFMRLAERIRTIEDAIRGLDTIPNSQQFRSGLTAFETCLNECLIFTQEFSGKHWFKRVLCAGVYKDKFEELNHQLKQVMMDLNLGLQVQQIMDHEQDKQDQAKDYQAICAKQDEIIQLNQSELAHLQKLEEQEQTHHQIIYNHLQSMQLRIAQLDVNRAMTKPLIDPNFEISFFELVFDKVLGKGSFGTVYLARWCEQPIAVKVIEGNLTPQDREQFIREVQIMSRLRSPGIVQFYGACLESGRACLAMEYMKQGSLYDLLGKTSLIPEQQQQLALDIARGLHYLHNRRVIHRDLKSANVLINQAGQAKITDFGLSKISSASIRTIQERSQAIQYHAPEILSMYPIYTEQSDIYSYGMIVWEIVTGKRPFAGLSDAEMISRIKQGQLETIPATVPAIYQQMIRTCWQRDPYKRPRLVDIIRELENHNIRPPSPNAEVLYEQGLALAKHNDYQSAFTVFQRSAAKGYHKALTQIGLFHLHGLGGATLDKSRAYEYLNHAAERGHARAQYCLGQMLEYGDGVAKDLNQALLWYKKAKDQGYQEAGQRFSQLSMQK